ncbi:MAG: LCP family protein [Oscillospiraceae bacterium]|nr:LCP family protein [Oscillospiraceae bacterium]
MNDRKHSQRKRPDPIPPQEDLYADYYPEPDPYTSGGAHLTPEERERYYAERDAYYAQRDAYYARRDAYYARREAQEARESREPEEWEDRGESYEEAPAPRPRRRTDPRDYEPEDDIPEPKKRQTRRRHRRRSRRALRRTLWLLLLAGLVLLLMGTAPVRNPGGAAREPGHSTILLAGTDRGGSRTDTIMLLSLERGERLRLLSIPRDTYVPNYSSYKLNAVYGAVGGGEAGMELLMDETAKILGFAPDGYALVDMDVVTRAVDILGGVDYDVPQDMDYDDPSQDLSIHLHAGEQHLNGEQVLGLLRFRSGYADADIGRTAVQRDFLRQALGQWLRPAHLRQLPALLSLYQENVTSSLRFRHLMWIVRVLIKADLKDMESQVLPGWPDMVNGSSVYMADQSAAAELLREYSPYKISP